MLNTAALIGFAATKNADMARRFYAYTLWLPLVEDSGLPHGRSRGSSSR
jgi:hypothetical protein